MKESMSSRVKQLWFISALIRVVKKLWGYIKRESNHLKIDVTVKIRNDENELETLVNVEVSNMTKDELIIAIEASSKLTKADAGRALNAALESSIKLRGFKAMEPEL